MAVGAAAGVQAYRLNVQRQMLRLEQQASLDRERTRIAQDMHDDLGANLTKIAIMTEVARQSPSLPGGGAHLRIFQRKSAKGGGSI
jgi:signal transduction histidine kinase